MGIAFVVLYFSIAITLVTISYYRKLTHDKEHVERCIENITPAPRRRSERFITFETIDIEKD
jgi:hypothetical protein